MAEGLKIDDFFQLKLFCDMEDIFSYESSETLEQIAQISCRCTVTGSVEHVEQQGCEQPDVVKDDLCCGWVLG